MRLLLALAIGLLLPSMASAASRLESATIQSRALAGNSIGISPARNITVYLPDGYDTPGKRFPVIYYLPHFFETDRTVFDHHDGQAVLDGAIRERTIPPMILVSVDGSLPTGGSWFVNSPVTGNWSDFVTREVVPFVDGHWRTLASPASRGVAGDRLGGYGAIRFGMTSPDVFGSVYALYPIGTFIGLQTMASRPNWDVLARARSLDDLKGDGFALIFTSNFQAHIPDPDHPPLHFASPMRREVDTLRPDPAVVERLHANFFLTRQIAAHADNLRRLHGFKFDWGRNDPLADHVFGNQVFSDMLDEFAVPYEAEEYRGGFGDGNWTPDGRVRSAMLPFFARHLAFE